MERKGRTRSEVPEGYGTRLIRELLKYEFDGAVDQRYAPERLTCGIVLPVDRLLAKHGCPCRRGSMVTKSK